MARRGVLCLLRAALKGAFVGFLAWLIGVTLFGSAALVLSDTSELIKFRGATFLPSAILLGVLLIGGEAALAFASAWMKGRSAGPLAGGSRSDIGAPSVSRRREVLHVLSTEWPEREPNNS
jgi:hypothetical protein